MGQKKSKKIIVTGNQGYIGSVLTEELMNSGYEVLGVDIGIFSNNVMSERREPNRQIIKDVRDIEVSDLAGSEAVIHLAGLSNDPIGELDPALTDKINYQASVRLAQVAQMAGVSRFLFSSSCSIYGASGANEVDETGRLDPKTAYAKSKAMVEDELVKMASDVFVTVRLRNATIFGYSPRLRLDLVVNNLTAAGYLNGRVTVLSDGTPWRPNLHVRDCARAFIFCLEAPAGEVNGQAFNVGINENNLQIKEIACLVAHEIDGSGVEIMSQSSPDERTYRVNFDKLKKLGWVGERLVSYGAKELLAGFKQGKLNSREFKEGRYNTLKRYQRLKEAGVLDDEFRIKELMAVRP